MKLFVFSSYNLTNIWAGIGARQWAISKRQANIPSLKGRAKNITIGSAGIFYCAYGKRTFTTPFLISSKPNFEKTVKDIWPEEWKFPFKIFPLGSPLKQISAYKLTSLLPSLKDGKKRWDYFFHIQGTTAFAPSEITDKDWEILISELSDI